METGTITARMFLVKGDVQGVGYRFFAVRAAARHQVKGYVRNLPGGEVEVLAQGPERSLDAFRNDLAAGPSVAEVTEIEERVIEPQSRFKAFLIEY